MSPLEMQKGVDYDLIADNITCMADRDGAQVFEVRFTCGIKRVLAHTLDDASYYAVEYRDAPYEED